jgi:S1-C subfamily serine protease
MNSMKQMDDIQLLEAIERYLTGDMNASETAQFELLRQKTPEIDQMVVEHSMFLHEMNIYANRINFSKVSESTFNKLLDQGEWAPMDEQSTSFKIIQLWSKYKKVTAIAASVGGFIALFTASLTVYISSSLNGSQVLQLSKAIEVIEKKQQAQGHILNEVKTKMPENATLISGGSGFLIDKKGYIVTNAHVLKGNSAIVINSIGQELKATIVYADKITDLALIKITDSDYKQPKNIPYSIREKSTELGEEIFTLGYPRNDNDIVYGKGYLSAQSGFEGDSNAYQIQISANPGYSGAPIFNNNAEIIGIINTRQKQAEGVAFAIKASRIDDLVESAQAQNKEDKSLKSLNHSLLQKKEGKRKKIGDIKNFIFNIRSYN